MTSSNLTTMSSVTHPIPTKLKAGNGLPTPHIGPDIDAYKKAHALTTGEHRDSFWEKVGI